MLLFGFSLSVPGQVCYFLVTSHWLGHADHLEVGGVSFVELLIFHLNVGWRAACS